MGVEQKLLLDSLNDLGNEKIVAVYVSELKPHPDEIAAAGAAGADAPQLAGTSFPQRYYHDPEEAAYRHIVMVGAGNWPFVMIHEVTHAAANLGHDGDSENLMNALVLQSDGSSFGDSKRIDKLQKSPILSSTFVQAGQ